MTASPELSDRLRAAFARYHGFSSPPTAGEQSQFADFQFHMTDWANDLARLARLYESPGEVSPEEAGDAVYGFLIHAVPHLMAAYRAVHGDDPRNIFAEDVAPAGANGTPTGEPAK